MSKQPTATRPFPARPLVRGRSGNGAGPVAGPAGLHLPSGWAITDRTAARGDVRCRDRHPICRRSDGAGSFASPQARQSD